MKIRSILNELATTADIYYHGSEKDIKFPVKINKPTAMRGSIINNRLPGFYLTRDKWEAERYSKGGYLYIFNLTSDDIVDCTNYSRNDGLESPSKSEFPFQSDFIKYSFKKFNDQRQKNNKDIITFDRFNNNYEAAFYPNKKEWNEDGLSADYLRDYLLTHDGVEFETELVIFNPKILKMIDKVKL